MPTNPDEVKMNPQEPIVGSIQQLTPPSTEGLPSNVGVLNAQVNQPEQQQEAAAPDLSGFNSCFRCGREKGGRVTLVQMAHELLCNFCL